MLDAPAPNAGLDAYIHRFLTQRHFNPAIPLGRQYPDVRGPQARFIARLADLAADAALFLGRIFEHGHCGTGHCDFADG